jgi:hypothetical protein
MVNTRFQRIGTLAPLLIGLSAAAQQVPKTWDEAALADWATPLAGLNERPTHVTSREYYSLPIENVRTYPIYYPGREPDGYWEMLQHVGPKPLIEPERLKTEADWIEAGRRVFDEADHIHLRTFDPKLIAAARNPATFDAVSQEPLPDGTIYGVRWVPTAKGVALTFPNCSNCHLLYLRDGTRIPGAPTIAGKRTTPVPLLLAAHLANHAVPAATPFHMPDEPIGISLYRECGVPWLADDVNRKLKTITPEEFRALLTAAVRGGAITRWNGSYFYPTKTPDLIGIKDRKYLDATATHLHRGLGDLMRYAALVSFAETAAFGPHHLLSGDTARVQARLPDEALYALALYLHSLQPPRNPNPFDGNAKAGQKIFAREGCAGCHTPPLYTNNKLTRAKGFTPPDDTPASLDMLPISVDTDPGLALKTRKGTGYYKVPSLKGVWYRGHYLHDGSATSLEEIFNPERLADSHVPGGWLPPGVKTRAIKGHEFGLKLDQHERDELIAFLRTL